MSDRVESADAAGFPAGPAAAPSPAPRSAPVLIGRAAELAQLRAAARRPPAVVVVEGDAGVGKTRLVRDWLAGPDLAGLVQLVGHCSPLREPLPFGPVVDALTAAAGRIPPAASLSAVTGALRPLLPELAHLLPPALEPLGSLRQERHRVFRGVRDLLASLGPVVLVLEDLHWADHGTRDLLRFLAHRPPDQLRLVLTYRREDLADPAEPAPLAPGYPGAGRLRLVLSPLDPVRTAELAATLQGAEVTAELAGRLHERTLGVPLAVEETLGQLSDRPVAAAGPPELPADPPAALREPLLARVARLGRSARRLLHAAAILGPPATEDLLVRVAGLAPQHGTGALAELVGRRLLGPADDDRYGFRHRLAKQVVHDSIPEPTRRALHRRAVTALAAGDGDPGQLARHCRAAGRIADWQRYAEVAADQAMAAGDDDTAAGLLREVVTRPDVSTGNRVRLAIKLGRAALTGLSHGEAMSILRRTLADVDLPAHARGELRLCLGILLRNQGRNAREGWAELSRAVQELDSCPGPAARAMASLGAPYLNDGRRIDEHLAWLARAADTARRTGDPELTAVVLANQATALVSTGDPAGWLLAGPVPDRPGIPPAHSPLMTVNLAWSATCVGRYSEAETLLRSGERLAAPPAGGYLACALRGTALIHDYAVGNWDGLATRAGQVATTSSEVPSVAAEAHLVLGLLALATGALREAERHLREATGSVPVAVAADEGLARLATARHQPAIAQRRVRHGLELVQGKGVACWAAELLPTAVALLGRTPRQQPVARKLLDELAAGMSGRDSPLMDAALAAGRAYLSEADGQHLAAAALHAEAAWAYGVLPRPYAAAQECEARGRCLLAAGEDGTGPLAEALAVFERLGATWDVARCRHLLRSLGQPLPHRRGRRGYGCQLSPRERDVVRLVRTGLTNREVAEALFLSPRTVEAHVARALRKLGLPSRRALAVSN